MSKGFAAKQQTKYQYIADYIRSSGEIFAGYRTLEEAKSSMSNRWFNQYCVNSQDYSVSELLTPSRQPLTIKNTLSRKGGKGVLTGYNGVWKIFIHPRSKYSLDFDISVIAGRHYRFHSDVIKHNIISHYGKSIYDQWRMIVKSDIDSLAKLVKEVRPQIASVPWSYTCSQSSANLCEQVGIKTYRGTAFLFPDSFA